MKKDTKQGFLGCGVILLIIIIVVIALSVGRENEKSKIKDLMAKVEEYGAMTGEYKAGSAATPMKIFIVQSREKPGSNGEKFEYSDIYFDIAKELRAANPSEVNTLFILDRRTMATGKYESGKIAYSRIIDVSVIDIASGNMILRETFTGSPPYTLVGNDSPYGDWPDYDVRDLIKDMSGGYFKTLEVLPTSN